MPQFPSAPHRLRETSVNRLVKLGGEVAEGSHPNCGIAVENSERVDFPFTGK
jgi:hypothetical protein